MMTKLRRAIDKVNALQIRIVALSLLVLCIGSGSQLLVNAMAAGTQPEVSEAKTTITILKTPTVISLPSTLHVHIRRAGVDSLGGYTVMENNK
ncbi:MAG: hypothetical protein NVS9B9_27820 [Ktedonobacteraceae bacterium]